MADRIEKFETKKIIGIILAGGQSRRFGGGNKFFGKKGVSLGTLIIQSIFNLFFFIHIIVAKIPARGP